MYGRDKANKNLCSQIQVSWVFLVFSDDRREVMVHSGFSVFNYHVNCLSF